MEIHNREIAVSDTSVLINFLAVSRVDLLVHEYQVLITNHVRREVTLHYPEELARLEEALNSGQLTEIVVATREELETFANLIGSPSKRLGAGECAAIAAAIHRNVPITIDDRVAIRHLQNQYPMCKVETTQSLIVRLIRNGAISIGIADQLKSEWENKFRFRLKVSSFAELL
jgi:predicted nucleic acid-binding protein